MKKISIPIVTRLQDNGDGGYTLHGYNNENELIADHPKSSRWDSEVQRDVPVVLTEDERTAILTEDDPYENGYIGSDTIEIEIDDAGNVKLAKPIRFHAGQ